MPSDKSDFKKTLDSYRAERGEFRVLRVPPTRYLMIDGHGDPNTSAAFAESVESLYPVAYKLKFTSARRLERDYVVPPLEGLWWARDMDAFTASRDKSRWDWTLMIMVPEWIEESHFTAAVEEAGKKRPPRLDAVRMESLDEGLCVQTLHLGPYDDEAPLLNRMHHDFIPGEGLRMTGRHHEIYLNDSRRTAPEKLRTLLRQPVEPLPEREADR
ncbi:GyrI-like domain-containing protein [Streptomyces sp. XM4193]|uniref:GyrI-like domain-containing protein n=1 Tax=Streptomyces sp. XM4193 TaxID=2929782 RepID=UPI001FF90983|nr:GyrI-like domain-containing protein [Streptomyces sp. XM4193]MCK1795183.1 GyrI-like domain-containing protein [Streptomyces sp. XM4193]